MLRNGPLQRLYQVERGQHLRTNRKGKLYQYGICFEHYTKLLIDDRQKSQIVEEGRDVQLSIGKVYTGGLSIRK